MWDAATKAESGNPNRDPDTGRLAPSFDNIQDRSSKAPTGTSAQAAIRRLTRDADSGDAKASSLLDRVTAGEIKPHAAAVEMGYRPKTITVRDDADALFSALLKVVRADEIALRAISACDDDCLRAIFAQTMCIVPTSRLTPDRWTLRNASMG